MTVDPNLYKSLKWRSIGPHRGGRVVAVAGHPTEKATFYFGACAGGVWKSDDAGQYWENISDGFFNTSAIGALAVSESDPNVIYAGTGETAIRGNVSHGDGVYKSTDGGRTWTNVGLADTRHISKVRIHPDNPDIVYVAALGHTWGPNEERGVFRSIDGGKSWSKILYKSDKAGAIDLWLDPTNPRILYAAIWEAQRHPAQARLRRRGFRHLEDRPTVATPGKRSAATLGCPGRRLRQDRHLRLTGQAEPCLGADRAR